MEYHKEDEDHWSYLTSDEADDISSEDLRVQKRLRKRGKYFEANREVMNELEIEETEFGPNDEDREMLVTSAG